MARKKSGKDKSEPQSTLYYFYTQERWDNWLKALEEMDFEGDPESEEMPEGLQSLGNFTQDINVSVLKIMKLFLKGNYGAETALGKLNEVEEIVMANAPEGELTDIIEGIQLRFLVLFLACKKVISGDAEGDIKTLVKDGRAVSDDDSAKALEIAATIGALVINGKSCCGKYLRGDMDEPTFFDDWLIEIDEMGASLKTLKNFDEQFGDAV